MGPCFWARTASAMSAAAMRGRHVLSSRPSSRRGAPMSTGLSSMAARAAAVMCSRLPGPVPIK